VNRSTNRSLALLIALALIACGKGEVPQTATTATTATAATKPAAPAPPSAAEAQTILESSQEWSEYQFTNAAYTLPLKRDAMNDPAKQAATDLANAGWIRLGGSEVELTAKAKGDKRFLLRPNGYVDLVPIAKKEFGSVERVQANADGSATAAFSWKWVPNEVGRAFQSGIVHDRLIAPQRATATLIHDGKSWTVLRIEESK
jgi:hypothetical protein